MTNLTMMLRGAVSACALVWGAAALAPARAAVVLPVASGGGFSVGATSWRDLPFRTVVRQEYDYSCGSAALATLLRYHYGRSLNEAQIFQAMYAVGDQPRIRKVGFSLLDLKRYLASLGYEAEGYRVPLADLEGLGAPGIALIKTGSYRHFVVIKGVRQGRVLLGDPALGMKSIALSEFAKTWSGIFFVITKSDRAKFNSEVEWRTVMPPVLSPYLAEQSTGALLRDMPTLYQITTVHVIH